MHGGDPASAEECPASGFVFAGTYPVGNLPSCIAAADFNGDGKLDAAVANEFSANVSVLLGNGNGTFAAAVHYPTEAIPSAVAIGDFNRDGKPDLAVANAGLGSVSVLLGNGDGTFQAGVSYPTGEIPRSVAVGDFNGDSKLDLAVANRASADVSVLLGNGDGTFQAAVAYLAGIDPLSVAVGDFNRDSSLDLIVANAALFDDPPSISALLGRGNGLFRNAVNYDAGISPRSIGIGDFNHDSLLDLAVANYGGFVGSQFTNGSVSVHLGNADGTFRTPIHYRAGEGPISVVVANLDRDGHLDLAVANNRSQNVSVLSGRGDGTFDGPTSYGGGANPRWVAAGDFDSDGKLDLTVVNDGGVLLLLQTCLTNADLSITQSDSPDPVVAGNNLVYTLTVTNAGPAPAPDATLTDRLPAGVTFVAATTSRGNCTQNSGTVACNLGNMANGSFAMVVITVTPFISGSLTNAATIASVVTTDPNTTNNTAIAVTKVIPLVSIMALDASASEAGSDPGVFRVNRTGGNSGALTINYTVAGTATNGIDYAGLSASATIPSGSASATLTVTPFDELAVEPTETVVVTLIPNPAYAINSAANSATVSILDDDDYWLSISDVVVVEANDRATNAVFTVSLSCPNSVPVTVRYSTVNSTANAGSDYLATNGTLTFVPGSTNQTVTVTVIGDVLNEANETFFVTLTSPTNGVIADGQGTGVINNDDPLPTLSIADATVTEGNSGTTNAVFTLSLSAVSGRTVTVNFASADGTARSGSDYGAINGTLTFAPGSTNQSVTVTVIGDLLNEANETFFVTLISPLNAIIADGQGTGTINNDDPLPSLSIADTVVPEGNSGTADAAFTVSLSAVSGQTVTVNFASADGTAQAGTDYTSINGALTFPAGTSAQTIRVKVNGDLLNEFDEAFVVALSSPGNATLGDGQATGTITNDDPLPRLSIADAAVTEGNSGSTNAIFMASLSAASGKLVSVNFATERGTVVGNDYVSASGVLSFSPGQTQQFVNVAVIGDTRVEVNETFFVNLSNPIEATLANTQALGTIINDDGVPSISIADASVSEGDAGTNSALFTLRLSASHDQVVTVGFATVAGTAEAGIDYLSTNGVVTFAPGTTNQTIAVRVLGDRLDEVNETYFVNLFNPSNAFISDSQGLGTILDDDPLNFLLSTDSVNVAEGGSNSFSVRLGSPPTSNVVVNTRFSNGDPSLTVMIGSNLTFNAGNWNVSQSVTLRASEDVDTADVNATFTVSSAALPARTLSVRGLDNDLEQFIRCSGDSAVFTTAPSGAGPFGYLWSKNAIPLAGRTNSSLIVTNVTAGDAGSYSVEISCPSYAVTKVGTLSVNNRTTATPLSGSTNCPGTTAIFSTVPGGSGPFVFVWRRNGTMLPGQTNSSLVITNVRQTDTGTYSVEVAGRCGLAASSASLSIANSDVCLLRITSVGLLGPDITIRFPTVPGEHYRVERTANLGSNVWVTVVDSVLGTGEPVQVTDVGGGSQPRRFYRVVLSSGIVPP
jgi:uncharacterized repeat protein (TIGR01451 family)